MPQMRQNGQKDGRMWMDAERELSTLFEEQILLQRWTGQTGGNPGNGQAPTQTFQSVHTRAVILDLSAADQFFPNAVFSAGDLLVQVRISIFGAINKTGEDGQTAGRHSDQIVYRGRTFVLVGFPHQQRLGGHVSWVCHARPVGA